MDQVEREGEEKAMKDFSHYRKRDRVLIKMGFASYRDYLKSDLWQRVRREVFQRKGSYCFLCVEAPATEIHHCRYQRSDFLGKRIVGMFPLCGACHRAIEFDEFGAKLTVPEMRRAFNLARVGRGRRLERLIPQRNF